MRAAGLWWWLNSPRDLELQLYCILYLYLHLYLQLYVYLSVRLCHCLSHLACGDARSAREPERAGAVQLPVQVQSSGLCGSVHTLVCFKDGGGGPRVPRAPRQGGGGEERLVEGSEPRACSSSRGVSAAARPPAVQIDITHQQRVDHVSLNDMQTCSQIIWKILQSHLCASCDQALGPVLWWRLLPSSRQKPGRGACRN